MAGIPSTFNGVDLATGGYLQSPLDEEGLVQRILAMHAPPGRLRALRVPGERELEAFGAPSERPEEVGCAVVLPEGCPAEVRAALTETLVAHRRTQIDDRLIKVLEHRKGETVSGWLTRHDLAMGVLDVDKVPFYLLLVGGPEGIPYSFEHLLVPRYAVGRLALDSAEAYRGYGLGVQAYERAATPLRSKEIVFWGPRHPGDRQTELSETHLIGELCGGFGAPGSATATPLAARCGFGARAHRAAGATKAELARALHPGNGHKGPALLFTASHGLGAPGTPLQRRLQGSLVCAAPGQGALCPEQYFGADDVTGEADLSGLVAVLFACFSAGTPARHRYELEGLRDCSADPPFVAALPSRMLGHPKGPALAVIGHVDRAWSYALQAPGVSESPILFWDVVNDLMGGCPVGYAHRHFALRYAALSTYLSAVLSGEESPPTPRTLARRWLERGDAQGYIVLGDPAVCLRDDAMEAP